MDGRGTRWSAEERDGCTRQPPSPRLQGNGRVPGRVHDESVGTSSAPESGVAASVHAADMNRDRRRHHRPEPRNHAVSSRQVEPLGRSCPRRGHCSRRGTARGVVDEPVAGLRTLLEPESRLLGLPRSSSGRCGRPHLRPHVSPMSRGSNCHRCPEAEPSPNSSVCARKHGKTPYVREQTEEFEPGTRLPHAPLPTHPSTSTPCYRRGMRARRAATKSRYWREASLMRAQVCRAAPLMAA